jgi:lipid-A-disaccharide synthase-like uncharacterized protein
MLVVRFDFWMVFGVIAQLMFTGRFVVQWIASERARRSVMPVAFWWLSVGGGMATLVYGIVRREPIIILGQAFAVFVYIRNMMLIVKTRLQRRDRAGA